MLAICPWKWQFTNKNMHNEINLTNYVPVIHDFVHTKKMTNLLNKDLKYC